MRRWLLIFLVFLLPLQYSWAMSAAYCAHEQDAQTQHWGHHEHPGNAAEDRSHADAGTSKDAGNVPNPAIGDCALCHFGHAQHAVTAPAEVPGIAFVPQGPRAVLAESFDSHIPEVPVRPAWPLAA